MVRVLIAVVLAAAAGGAASVLRRRRPDAPTNGPSWHVPAQLDRADFARPDAPWLVAAFTSATCETCAAVWQRAEVLASQEVEVQQLESRADRRLHERYRVDAVPLVLIADSVGVVRRHFLGPLRAQDLWGALAELRSPGSLPPGCSAGGECVSTRGEAGAAGPGLSPG